MKMYTLNVQRIKFLLREYNRYLIYLLTLGSFTTLSICFWVKIEYYFSEVKKDYHHVWANTIQKQKTLIAKKECYNKSHICKVATPVLDYLLLLRS